MIPTTLLSELREKAKAATAGPWFVGIAYEAENGPVPADYKSPGYHDNIGVLSETNGETAVGCDEFNVFNSRADADFIAAANPSTILALLDEIERLSAGQRTEGTVEVCSYCGEKEDGEAWEYGGTGRPGYAPAPWAKCPQPKCPLRAHPKEMKK